MPDLRTIAERSRHFWPQDFDGAVSAAATCLRSGVLQNVLRNYSSAARAALCAGMLAIRWDKDVPSGRQWFARGASVAHDFLTAASQNLPAARWLSHHLIYCNLLCEDWGAARSLANWADRLSNVDPRLTDDDSEAFAGLLALFVLDRSAEFHERREDYLQRRGKALHPFWRWQTVYLDLFSAVLEHNQNRLGELMELRERKFVERTKDRRAGESRPEYGGGDESPFAIDFMGTAIAKTAIARGLTCEFDSEFVPAALLREKSA